jgi:hypothetical protein
MTSADHDVIEAFRRVEQEMQDEWEVRQAAAAKAPVSLRPEVLAFHSTRHLEAARPGASASRGICMGGMAQENRSRPDRS